MAKLFPTSAEIVKLLASTVVAAIVAAIIVYFAIRVGPAKVAEENSKDIKSLKADLLSLKKNIQGLGVLLAKGVREVSSLSSARDKLKTLEQHVTTLTGRFDTYVSNMNEIYRNVSVETQKGQPPGQVGRLWEKAASLKP
jgi:hypothetical protein